MTFEWAAIVPLGVASISAIFQAGRVTQKVNGLEGIISKIDKNVEKVDAKVDRVIERQIDDAKR